VLDVDVPKLALAFFTNAVVEGMPLGATVWRRRHHQRAGRLAEQFFPSQFSPRRRDHSGGSDSTTSPCSRWTITLSRRPPITP